MRGTLPAVGEIISSLLTLIGSLAGTDGSHRRHPLTRLGWGLVVLMVAGLALAWVLG
jgi:hypothetical protein